jgi:hypothetical protein
MRFLFKKNSFLTLFLGLFGSQVGVGALQLAGAVSRVAELRDAVSDRVVGARGRFSDVFNKKKDNSNDLVGDEIKLFASRQWTGDHLKKYLRTHENMTKNEKPQFIVFFAHGYRPFLPSFQYAKDRFLQYVAPFLRSFKYLAYHPLLKVGPKYTAFAQGSDVEQVKYHLDQVLAMTDNPESPLFNLPIIVAGHSNGSATIISLLGLHPELKDRIAGLLLFAPYADIRKTGFLQKIGSGAVVSRLVNRAPNAIGMRYDSSKKAPISYVLEGFFPRLPVFLVHCKNDPLIPFSKNFLAFQKAFAQPQYADTFQGFAFERGAHGGFSSKSTKADRRELKKALQDFCEMRILVAPASGLKTIQELLPAALDV